jgi:hypothetical protein
MSKELKHEGRADETQPPLGEGGPEPPLAEPTLPVGKVRVYGDASATYGSMIPPDVIRPWADEVDEITEPARQKQEKSILRDKGPTPEKREFGYVDAKDDQAFFVHTKEPPGKVRRYPGEGDPIQHEFDPNPGLYVEKKENKAPHAEGKAAEDERNLKREAKEDKSPAKGPHDR